MDGRENCSGLDIKLQVCLHYKETCSEHMTDSALNYAQMTLIKGSFEEEKFGSRNWMSSCTADMKLWMPT